MAEVNVAKQNLETIEVSGFKLTIDKDRYHPTIINSMVKGAYEAKECSALPKMLAEKDRVLEVGGATGLVSMVCASLIGESNVLSFEANPEMIEDAKTNYKLNGLNIKNKNGILKNRMHYQGRDTYESFFIHQEFWASNTFAGGNKQKIKVPCYCFEEEALSFSANVLVCDIEGGEIDLLYLADLSSFDKILLEIHNWAGRDKINALIRKLILDGFSVDFDISATSVIALHRGLTNQYARSART